MEDREEYFVIKDIIIQEIQNIKLRFKDKTNIIPPKNIDVSLVAPKGAGSTVRDHFLRGSGINTSYAIYQD